MVVIKLRDRMVAHDKDFIKNTSFITYERTPVNTGDIVLYTDNNAMEHFPQAKHNIMFLLESPELNARHYQFVFQNYKKFDLILTFSKKILSSIPNSKFNVYGTTWLHPSYRQIYSKSKLCSTIASSKKMCFGHRLRHDLIDDIQMNNLNVDLYGGRFGNLPSSNEPNPKTLSNGKILALRDYMFSLTIENCREDYYFTEKLIDCFLSGTVPIYWGCPSIGDFFNNKGILTFETKEQGLSILSSLSESKYIEMKPYIEENFTKALNYVDFSIDETHIRNLIDGN